MQNVDPFPNHYKIFIQALAFIAQVYQFETFPSQDAIIEHICQSIESRVNINIFRFFKTVNQRYHDINAFLKEICLLETKIE